MAKITVREASDRDVESIAVLASALGYPSDAEAIARRLDAVETHHEGKVFVAENPQGEIVGWTHVLATHRLTGDSRAELSGLVVAPAARGSGVGRILVEAAESWARNHGLFELTIRANVVRGETHRFYRHLGYGETKRQVVFRRSLQDEES